MRNALIASAALFHLLVPASASAWGFAAHQFIMRQAIEQLPPELKPFFERHREVVVLRVTDPDLWRNLGWPDDPNHFMDFGVREYGPYPFTDLPREYGAALEKFGAETLDRNGRLPWRLAEMFGKLRRGFEGFTREAPYAVSDVTLFSAVVAHYIQDAYQPLHATDNYDGAQTGQRGVHSRFERDLFERYQSRLTIPPPGQPVPDPTGRSAGPQPITNPRDAAFDALLVSYKLVDELLEADRKASEGRDRYDEVFFERFFERVRPMLERQLAGAIAATAGLINGAWVQAGRPMVRLDDVRPVQKIERAR